MKEIIKNLEEAERLVDQAHGLLCTAWSDCLALDTPAGLDSDVDGIALIADALGCLLLTAIGRLQAADGDADGPASTN